MPTSQEYRQFAAECINWARTAKSDDERQQFLKLANVWVQAASLLDGKPPIAPTSDKPSRH